MKVLCNNCGEFVAERNQKCSMFSKLYCEPVDESDFNEGNAVSEHDIEEIFTANPSVEQPVFLRND